MVRFQNVTAADMDLVATLLDLDLDDTELRAAADRCEALSGIYRDLETAPRRPSRSTGDMSDIFKAPPRRASSSEDEYNAWITRFDLSRPDTSGLLDGHTIAIKDNTCVRGVELTGGSHAFEGIVPNEHATVVERFLEAGGRIVGKTNMDELAFGPTSETSAFGPTRNPANPEHVAGGSSSGSAAAVAAGEVDLALGTDTGGSVRIPASYCGIVGVKPTYGHVPSDGVLELARSLDHVGVLAQDVDTAARGLNAIASPHPDGSEPRYTDDLGYDLDTLSVGVVDRFFETHVSTEVGGSVRAAIDDLVDRGATIEHVEIPALEYSREGWWGIAPVEFAAWYLTDGVGLWRRDRPIESLSTSIARARQASSGDLGSNIKEMLALGGLLMAKHQGYHYTRANEYRLWLRKQFDEALSSVDVIATPATPTTALEVGGFERGVTPPVNCNTHPLNLTGHPAVTVPCGETGGLPVGLQFVADHWQDETALNVAHAYEQHCG